MGTSPGIVGQGLHYKHHRDELLLHKYGDQPLPSLHDSAAYGVGRIMARSHSRLEGSVITSYQGCQGKGVREKVGRC